MRCLLPLCLCVLASAAVAHAEVYVVNPGGTGDFATIQEAVDAISDGDVIELTDGVFRGEGNRDVDFRGKAITIRSQGSDPFVCIVDCEGSGTDPHRGFIFHSYEGDDSVLEGLTITNGYSLDSGGGVLCLQGSPRIRNCVFMRNASEGEGSGGCFALESAALAQHCVFAENTAELGGGASTCVRANVTFEWCTFSGNSADRGGGLRV